MKNSIKYEYGENSEGTDFPFTSWNKVTPKKEIKNQIVFSILPFKGSATTDVKMWCSGQLAGGCINEKC